MIRACLGKTPTLGRGAWVADTALVVGDVVLGEDASVWYGAVIRADTEGIRIGRNSNIQDNSVVHVESGEFPTNVGDNVTVGHAVVLHGCTIRDGALIGIGAVVLNGAEVGEGALIAAGSLVTPGAKIPPGVLALGAPCRVKRELTEAERKDLRDSSRHYVQLAREHR